MIAEKPIEKAAEAKEKVAFADRTGAAPGSKMSNQTSMKAATSGAAEAKEEEFKTIVRLVDKDIEGGVPVPEAINKVKGVGFMFANAVCNVLHLNKKMSIGAVSSEEFQRIEDCIRNPAKYKIPAWLYNRRKDRETGEDKHILSSELDLTKKFDIQFLRKIRSWRGYRHAKGDKGLKVKVRGQRTRSTGRKGKSVGVQRKKNVVAAGKAAAAEGKSK